MINSQCKNMTTTTRLHEIRRNTKQQKKKTKRLKERYSERNEVI